MRLAKGLDKVRRRVHIVKRLLRRLQLSQRFSIPLFVYYMCLWFIWVYDNDCFDEGLDEGLDEVFDEGLDF
jgi:hypothetical protein